MFWKIFVRVLGTVLVLGAGTGLTYVSWQMVLTQRLTGGRFVVWGWIGVVIGLIVLLLGVASLFARPSDAKRGGVAPP